MKYKCIVCKDEFKNECDLNSHVDIHTPYWNTQQKLITLSGADQIRLLLKDLSGGWDKLISDETKRLKQKGDYDLKKLIKIREFEDANGIEFIVCGDTVKEYRCLA